MEHGYSQTTLVLTEEQKRIVDAAEQTAHQGEPLVVDAGAGTGKTSTLVAIADRRRRAGARVAYLAYSRPLRDEAIPRFQGKADVFTVHSLAYRALGVGRSTRRLARLVNNDAIAALGLRDGDQGLLAYTNALAILQTLDRFLQTADTQITADHVPDFVRRKSTNPDYASWVARQTAALFDMAKPGARTTLPLPHDLYLKAWQLKGTPGLDIYDTVLFDEAQDANPVILAAVRQARHAIYVGDPHQQIFAYRGAVNAMRLINGTRLALTQSFRFGPAIAELANRVLAEKEGPVGFQLRGNPARPTRIGRVNPARPSARIYRTNAELLADALFMEKDLGRPTRLVGDWNDLRERFSSALALRSGDRRSVKHPVIRGFDCWADLQDATLSQTQTPDPELVQVVQLVNKYSERLDDILTILENAREEVDALMVMTTAHRSKGREWPQAVLGQDFDRFFLSSEKPPRSQREAELNLLYVAVTRAGECLELQSQYALELAKTL